MSAGPCVIFLSKREKYTRSKTPSSTARFRRDLENQALVLRVYRNGNRSWRNPRKTRKAVDLNEWMRQAEGTSALFSTSAPNRFLNMENTCPTIPSFYT
jgi:hypothetical protein